MKQKITSLAIAGIMSLVFIACSKNSLPKAPSKLQGDLISQWNETAYESFGGTQYQHSLQAARLNAMVHLAMHDALNAIENKYERYAFTGKDRKADPVVAASYAAYTVLLNQVPAKKNFLDSALAYRLHGIDMDDAQLRGIELGKAAAQAVLIKRLNDGADADPIGVVVPSVEPGVYQVVPPFNFVFAPTWVNMKLFSLQSKDQFRPAPHPALNSAAYATAFNEVKATGRLLSDERTADQSAYTTFWYEFSEAGWNRVARVTSAAKKLNLLEAARLFALVDVAMADAYTAGWDAKFHYNFWRPYTAIRNAASDGNDATQADPEWEPFMPTPPVQDYPSTHSALGNAAATVLARLLGDQTAFSMSAPTAQPNTPRNFISFSQAANENADSRVRAGIHFRFSCEAGQKLGNKIGNWVVDKTLAPVK